MRFRPLASPGALVLLLSASLRAQPPTAHVAAPTPKQTYARFKLAPELPRGDRERTAVKLTYLMTDDKRQSPQSLKMLKLLDGQPTRDIHNVVLRDGYAKGDARLYYLNGGAPKADGLRADESTLAPGLTEVQSNNPKVLSEVVKFAFSKYPGKRKYLEIYTHGGGVRGIGTDRKQYGLDGKRIVTASPARQRTLSVPEFGDALRTGLQGRTLDAVYLRSCLMGNVEALYELKGLVHYAVASEDVSWSVKNSNLNMTKLFDDLAAKNVEPREVVRQLAIQGHAKNPRRKDGSFSGFDTIVAVDVDKMSELKGAINGLVASLNAAMPKEGHAILKAYDSVPFITRKANRFQSRDLWAFTAALQQRVADPGVQKAVSRTRAAQREVMVYEADALGHRANGLSIFMPRRKDLTTALKSPMYSRTRFAQDSAWGEFLGTIAAAKDATID